MSALANPITIRVRCSGRLHCLTWQQGRLVANDHGPHDLRLSALLDAPTRCGAILAAVRADERPISSIVPPALKRAIRAHHKAIADARTQWPDRNHATIRSPHDGIHLEARGRNGWFRPSYVAVRLDHRPNHKATTAAINIASEHRYRTVAPIFLYGPREELLRLFQQIIAILAPLHARHPAPPRRPIPVSRRRPAQNRALSPLAHPGHTSGKTMIHTHPMPSSTTESSA